MKKIVLAIAAVMTINLSMMAQEGQTEGQPQQGQRSSKTEMLKHRTDAMVKSLGLNEQQATQLLDLNTRYADKIGPRTRPQGHEGQRFQGRGGARRGNFQRADSVRAPRTRVDSLRRDTAQIARRPQQMRQRPVDGDSMRKNFEAYDAELKKILTEEQYKAYKAQQQQQRQRPQRQQRDR